MRRDADFPLRPVVEIDLDALAANYSMLSVLAKGAETAGVVKCDAYGLGAAEVGRRLAEEGCRSFFVAYPHEGAALRRALGSGAATIYVFNGPDSASLALFNSEALTPILNTLEQAELWARAGDGAPAALHIDTGMNRLGLPQADVGAVASNGALNVSLVMSHLACSSDPAHAENIRQHKVFESLAARFPAARRSLAASGGALIGPDYHFDLIRPGAALYGVSPFDTPDGRLKPVARLTAPVVQIRAARKGERVGYGGATTLSRESRLATVSLGYGDGVHRSASPGAEAALGGVRCRIMGRISMDLIVLDATDALDIRIGDRAEFFGPALPIEEAAASSGTIGYELLTSLGPRVLRRYAAVRRG
jgi:alanine racemase